MALHISSGSKTAYLDLTGIGSGAGATVDPAQQISFGTGLSVAGLATDNAGNVYVSDATSKKVLRFASSALTQGSSATSTSLAMLTAPGAVAVDPRGYVYAADTSTGLITQITPAGTASALPFTFTAPAGLAVDALNNLYVSDSSAQAVYQINPITGVERNLNLGSLVTPKGLTIDPSANLLVADPGVPAIYRFNPSGTRTTVTTSATAPSAILTDAAGNLLIADTADILAVPSSSNSSAFTVASLAPQALAIDSAGNLYTGASGGVLQLARTQGYVQFAGPATAPQTVSLLESGNQALTLSSISQSDTTDFGLSATASTDCTLSSGLPSALAVGGVCTLSSAYTPTIYLTTTDTVGFTGNYTNAALSTPSSLQLTLTGPATPPASVTVLQATPSSSIYGQTITLKSTTTPGFSIPSPLVPAGSVTFYIDSSTQLTAKVDPATGIATVSAPTLNAGSHQFYSTYTSSNGYSSSTSATVNVTIGQASATINVTPYTVTYDATSHMATGTATGLGSLNLTADLNLAGTSHTNAGTYTTDTWTFHDPIGNYADASDTVSDIINQANPTLAWASPTAITYGTALSGTQLNASATGVTGASLPGVFTYAPLSGTVVAAGTQTLSVSFAPTDITNYTTPATKSVQLQVNKALPTIALVSNLNPILLQNPVTYTATVSSTAGKPAGTVTFQDGGVAITACTGVSVTVSTGQASCAVTYTATGTHSINALYNGDANFLSAGPSNTVSEAVIDISLGTPLSGNGTGTSATILPGSTATYSFPIAPSSGTTFPLPITFTVTSSPALPTDTTMTLTPPAWSLTSNNPWSWTLPANTTLASNTVLSIQVPQTIAALHPMGGNLATRLAPFSLALILLPFAGRLRKTGKRLGRMLAVVLLAGAGLAATAGLSGCGSTNGFFAQAQRSYTMTVTVASGTLSHTSTITLTVE
jgi:sugar lactone lactonase YvrE